ncbi:hypothetical protein [Fulvimarina sp. MAC3]|uniref:hypothetical protein n=1 Tax=Fulvimarina sp. MAC3 TaxID=3148887 RepID=UPI0031FCC05C
MSTIVFGASGLVGTYVVSRLRMAGEEPVCLTRSPEKAREKTGFRHLDFGADTPLAQEGDDVISLIPLSVFVTLLPRLERADRIVALGSTSLHSKIRSSDPREVEEARAFAEAEAVLAEARGPGGAVVLRPTLIYDGLRDRNITTIARMARRLKIVPIAKPGNGLRQPIHADDVAGAVQAVLARWDKVADQPAYDLPGTDTMPYHEMVERIVARAEPRARIIPIPVKAIEAGLRIARLLGSTYTVGAANRINADQAYDGTEIWQRLGFEPRPFRPHFPPPGHSGDDVLPRREGLESRSGSSPAPRMSLNDDGIMGAAASNSGSIRL